MRDDPTVPIESGGSDAELLTQYMTALRGAGAPESLLDRAPLTRMGRYVVLRQLGEGGMGVVLAAYDEQLDRRVAIKVLFDGRGSHDELRGDLIREAQALARLAHPNVVSVFEVGEEEGRVYMAMELVHGPNLREAADRAREDRGWRGVLELYRQAGLGLQAAHDAGLLHRDFKPNNAVVDDGGRVRVLDFGLARAFDPAPSTRSEDRVGVRTGGYPEVDERVSPTVPGKVMGTPAYMSPEQHMGDALDARSDQFSYCVSLYEGLFGERPYQGRSVNELSAKVHAGVVEPPAQEIAVPGWLRKAVMRGLSPDPEGRWPSMQALLDEFDRQTERRRSWMTIGVIAVTLVSAAGYVGASGSSSACPNAGEGFGSVWNDESRVRLQEAIFASEQSVASPVWERVEATLDTYADEWASAYTDACVVHDQKEQSDQLYDHRVLCLDERRDAVEQVIDVLAVQQTSAVEHAIPMTMRLPSVDDCADIEVLTAQVSPPRSPADREQVAALRRQLARVRALEQSEHYDKGIALAEEVLVQARALDYAPLVAEALVHQGSGLAFAGQYEGAERALTEGFRLALSSGHDETAVTAARSLVHLLAVRFGRHEDAGVWGQLAQSLVERTPMSLRTRATVLSSMGQLEHERQEYARAKEHFEAALEIYREVHPEDHPDVAKAINHVGHQLEYLGQYDDARALYEKSLQMTERVLGPDSEAVANQLLSIAYLALSREDWERAQHWLARSEDAFTRRGGPEHQELAYVDKGFAEAARGLGDAEAEYRYLSRARERVLQRHGAKHILFAAIESDLADLDLAAGRWTEANARLKRVVEVFEGEAAPGYVHHAYAWLRIGRLEAILDHRSAAKVALSRAKQIALEASAPIPELLAALDRRLAELARLDGDLTQASRLLDSAEALMQQADEEGQQMVASVLHIEQAHFALHEGRDGDAIAVLTPMLDDADFLDCYPEDRARARFVLAQAKSKRGGSAEEVRSLVRTAVEELREAHMPERVDVLEAWLTSYEDG